MILPPREAVMSENLKLHTTAEERAAWLRHAKPDPNYGYRYDRERAAADVETLLTHIAELEEIGRRTCPT